MDTIKEQTRQLALPQGQTMEMTYRLLRQLLLASDGTPVCELYGIQVTQRQPDAAMDCVIENLTTDYDKALTWMDKLVWGLVTADTAKDVLYDLVAEDAMLS